MKIAVAGTGYVGLSMAALLSQNHNVTAVDIIPEKVEMINRRVSPIQDEYIEKYFAERELDLKATLDASEAYRDADFVVIAAPTNYDPKKNFFDTSAVENVIETVLSFNPDAVMATYWSRLAFRFQAAEMCLFRESLLNWVSTLILKMPELIKLFSTKSMIR